MLQKIVCLIAVLCVPAVALGEDAPDEGEKRISGMSVVGNHESPKSLVIVPWKASAPGATLDVSRIPDDGRQPVDREVFMRELSYYQLRVSSGDEGDFAAK